MASDESKRTGEAARRAKLATYAARCIENEILLTKEVRKDNPHLFVI